MHKAKDFSTPTVAWRTAVLKQKVLNDLSWKDEKGPMLKTEQHQRMFERQHSRNFWEVVECTVGFPKLLDIILNWTELKQVLFHKRLITKTNQLSAWNVLHLTLKCRLLFQANIQIKPMIHNQH